MFNKLKAKIKEQEAIINAAITENRAMSEEECKKFNDLESEIKNLEATIEAQGKILTREKEDRKPINEPIFAQPRENKPLQVFKNFYEQLKAIKNTVQTGRMDDRLEKLQNMAIQNAASGMNEGVDSEGGFVVQTDFAGTMMETAATSGEILSRVDSYQCSGNANGVKWNDIDETDVSTTVFGGIQVYWASEAGSVTASKPVLAEKELKLLKLMGLFYDTYELSEDSTFTSQVIQRGFELAIQRKMEGCVLSGTGVGQPLGILNSGSKVQVTKETGQASATVLYENIVKMYNRQLNKNSAAWLMHPDAQEQLDFMTFPLGVGGVPVYLQASAQGQLSTLKGKAIVESDHCSALGTVGDINFVDLSQYLFIYKGGVQTDVSMHVNFLTAENAYRFIFRCNGMPKKNSTLTLKNSSNARSSFVVLQTR